MHLSFALLQNGHSLQIYTALNLHSRETTTQELLRHLFHGHPFYPFMLVDMLDDSDPPY